MMGATRSAAVGCGPAPASHWRALATVSRCSARWIVLVLSIDSSVVVNPSRPTVRAANSPRDQSSVSAVDLVVRYSLATTSTTSSAKRSDALAAGRGRRGFGREVSWTRQSPGASSSGLPSCCELGSWQVRPFLPLLGYEGFRRERCTSRSRVVARIGRLLVSARTPTAAGPHRHHVHSSGRSTSGRRVPRRRCPADVDRHGDRRDEIPRSGASAGSRDPTGSTAHRKRTRHDERPPRRSQHRRAE